MYGFCIWNIHFIAFWKWRKIIIKFCFLVLSLFYSTYYTIFRPQQKQLEVFNKNIFFKLFYKDFYILKDFDFFWLIFYFDSFWNEIPCIFNSNLHKTNRWWDHSVHFWYFPLFRFLLNVSFSRPTDVPKIFEPIRKYYLTWHSFFQIHYG